VVRGGGGEIPHLVGRILLSIPESKV